MRAKVTSVRLFVFHNSKNAFPMGTFIGSLTHINSVREMFLLFVISIAVVKMEFIPDYLGGHTKMAHISND